MTQETIELMNERKKFKKRVGNSYIELDSVIKRMYKKRENNGSMYEARS